MDYFFMSREDEKASSNPILVMLDEKSGSRYARLVGRKGLGTDGEMDWLIEDILITLKGWGHAGGPAMGQICLAQARAGPNWSEPMGPNTYLTV